MRLSTIWSLPSMTMAERFRRTVDWSAMTVAANLPQRIRYWATLQEVAKATKLKENIMATTLDEVLKNLEGPKG